MKNLYYLLLLLLASSCVSLDKAIRVATKNESHAEATQQALNDKHRLIVVENCAVLVPVLESQETKTETEKGNVDEFKQRALDAESKADSLEKAAKVLPVKPECEPEVKARDKVISALKSQITDLSRQAQQIRADKERVLTTITKKSTAEVEAERLKRLKAEKAQSAAEGREQQQIQANNELQNKLTKSYWFAGILLAITGLMFYWFVIRRR